MAMRALRLFSMGSLPLLAAACQPSMPSSLHVQMDFTRAEGFYSAPFPSDDLRHEETLANRTIARIDLSRFPNPGKVPLVRQALDILSHDARGFGLASGVFFTLRSDHGAIGIDPSDDTQSPDAPMFLLDLERGTRHPTRMQYTPDGGPFGAPNMLSLLPVQGIPLRERTRYAAVIRRDLPQRTGETVRFAASPQVAQLVAGDVPAGLSPDTAERYRHALRVLADQGIAADDIAGLSVFTTDDPLAQTRRFMADLRAQPRPAIERAFTRSEVFADYCVYHTTIPMLDYQQGEPPYTHAGGGWVEDETGKPVPPHGMRSNFWLTVPRRPMPTAGYPTAVFVRTGGGGDRPLVDRGPQRTPGGPAITDGSGPAHHFAQTGFAALSVDGPLGGLRNPDREDEQFLIFNIQNPTALRDNVRQSAIEIALLPALIDGLRVDTSDCPGAAATTTLDTGTLALMGHSTGSVIATLAASLEPRYRALVLSGAGASWVENVLHKRKPIEVKPVAELLIGYASEGRSLHEHDPVLSLVQWAADPADGQLYAGTILHAADTSERHVLMLQGIVDNYIRPPIALSQAVPLGLDLAGPALDSAHPDLKDERHLMDVLPLVARGQIDLPVSGNQTSARGKPVTAIVVQHPQDPYQDGHEVVFQSEPPQHQYRCFLETWLRGTPRVPIGAAANAPCTPR